MVAAGTDTDGHRLVDTIVYGPVRSRRFGDVLGLNLSPMGRKVCAFECVYCQLGHARGTAGRFPSVQSVHEALEASANAGFGAVNGIVISGNGEPTLHPRFAEVVDVILAARSAWYPERLVICLTSGSELHHEGVVAALRRLDEYSVKLDAGSCKMLHRIALPQSPFCVPWLTSRIRALGGAVIQACFFDGPFSNAGEDDVAEWVNAVRDARPRRVDLYTISRPAPSSRIRPLPAARLHEIADRLRSGSTLPVRVLS